MQDVKWVKGIKAIGFDIDGTLCHIPTELSAIMGKKVIEWAAAKLGRDEDEFAEEYIARREQYRGNTRTLNSYGLPGEEIFQKMGDEFPLENFLNRDDRLVKMMTNLKKKYRLFVITNGTARQADKKLKVLGLDIADFDPRIYCYDQGWVKPDPQPFLAAIESLVMKPEEIVYIGDREDVDIEGAQAVGMKTILVGGKSKKADASCETVYDVELMLE